MAISQKIKSTDEEKYQAYLKWAEIRDIPWRRKLKYNTPQHGKNIPLHSAEHLLSELEAEYPDKFKYKLGSTKTPQYIEVLRELLVQLFYATCFGADIYIATPRSDKVLKLIGIKHLDPFINLIDVLKTNPASKKTSYIKVAPYYCDKDNPSSNKLTRSLPTKRLIKLFEKFSWDSSHLVLPPDKNDSIKLRMSKAEFKEANKTEPESESLSRDIPQVNWMPFKQEMGADPMEDIHSINKFYQETPVYINKKASAPMPPSYLYRVFNDRSWVKGGRWYGHSLQQMASAKRNKVMFGSDPAVEIDYSNLHLFYAYNNRGARIPVYEKGPNKGKYKDLYNMINTQGLTGLGKLPSDEKLLRKIKKTLVLCAINAEDDLSTIRGCTQSILKNPNLYSSIKKEGCSIDYRSIEALLDRTKAAHKEISGVFGRGNDKLSQTSWGKFYQYKDSQAILAVLRVLIIKLRVPVIPIHDSILLPEKHKQLGSCLLKLAHFAEWQVWPELTVTPKKSRISYSIEYGTDDPLWQAKVREAINEEFDPPTTSHEKFEWNLVIDKIWDRTSGRNPNVQSLANKK